MIGDAPVGNSEDCQLCSDRSNGDRLRDQQAVAERGFHLFADCDLLADGGELLFQSGDLGFAVFGSGAEVGGFGSGCGFVASGDFAGVEELVGGGAEVGGALAMGDDFLFQFRRLGAEVGQGGGG